MRHSLQTRSTTALGIALVAVTIGITIGAATLIVQTIPQDVADTIDLDSYFQPEENAEWDTLKRSHETIVRLIDIGILGDTEEEVYQIVHAYSEKIGRDKAVAGAMAELKKIKAETLAADNSPDTIKVMLPVRGEAGEQARDQFKQLSNRSNYLRRAKRIEISLPNQSNEQQSEWVHLVSGEPWAQKLAVVGTMQNGPSDLVEVKIYF